LKDLNTLDLLQLEQRASELRRVAIRAINLLRAYGHDHLADELLEKMVGPAEIKKGNENKESKKN
jgi:hypothetical protein